MTTPIDPGPRRVAILQLVANGYTNKEIGREVGYSEDFVCQILVTEIYPYLNLPKNMNSQAKRAKAVYEAMKQGIIQ